MAIDHSTLNILLQQVSGDPAAGMSGVMVNIGHKLGLYRAMACDGPLTPAALASKTDASERYLRAWLDEQAAAGHVSYDPSDHTYGMSAANVMALAAPKRPCLISLAFEPGPQDRVRSKCDA